MNVVTATKRYVADDRYRLRLFDTVAVEIRRVLDALRDPGYSVTAEWSDEEFLDGLYEQPGRDAQGSAGAEHWCTVGASWTLGR